MIPNHKELFSFSKQEVEKAFETSKQAYKVHGLKILKTASNLPYGRMLIITPRVCGKAHDRNKARRRIKSIFYEEKLYAAQITWIVLVRKDLHAMTYEMLKQHILRAITA